MTARRFGPEAAAARWIDPEAPFELVEPTALIRDAYASLDGHRVDSNCWEASGLIALAARQRGFPEATWEAVSQHGDDHVVCRAGKWWCDPTSEQFGYDGPWVFETIDFGLFFDERRPDRLPSLTYQTLRCRFEEWAGFGEPAVPALYESVGLDPPW
jgi:hypothetical protein